MRRQGFTLVEIMIAITVVTLGVLPVYYLLTASTRGISVGIREIKAVNHCANLVELMRGLEYHTISKFCDGGALEAQQRGHLAYNRETHIWELFEHPTDGMLTPNFEVLSGSDKGREFFEDLSTGGEDTEGILPPMESYFFSRRVKLNCEENFVRIKVDLSWKTEVGENDRDFSLQSVVISPKKPKENQ